MTHLPIVTPECVLLDANNLHMEILQLFIVKQAVHHLPSQMTPRISVYNSVQLDFLPNNHLESVFQTVLTMNMLTQLLTDV